MTNNIKIILISIQGKVGTCVVIFICVLDQEYRALNVLSTFGVNLSCRNFRGKLEVVQNIELKKYVN